MKKILITGGSGLIGTILNNHLNANYDVQNLDRNKPNNKEYNIFIGNINKYEDVLESSKDASAIIHLGAAVQMDSDWKLVFNNNIEYILPTYVIIYECYNIIIILLWANTPMLVDWAS